METPLQVTARHFDAPPALRDHAARRLQKLERFYDGIVDARVVLDDDGGPPDNKKAEITLGVYQKRLSASSSAATHEEAIDDCTEGLRRQLKTYKGKLHSTDQDRY
ncbi:MAG: ribosome-associated translation inhibitor RaiA [Bacteroidetes bacterium QS_9_68_14]|nr:MAG: ribosome-associated translation inhibitor RaiA [Bacteroidetes bacterium QS_9_68_14]